MTSEPTARRGRSFHRAGTALRRRISEAAAKRGFAEPDILLRWPEIVGAELAEQVRPVQISYGRASPGFGATLVVQVPGARATEIEHRAGRIVERVNAFYGYRAVSRLKLTQATGRRRAGAGLCRGAGPLRRQAAFVAPSPPNPAPPRPPAPPRWSSASARRSCARRSIRLGARVLSAAAAIHRQEIQMSPPPTAAAFSRSASPCRRRSPCRASHGPPSARPATSRWATRTPR